MIEVILDRILVKLEDIKREHDLGNGVKLEIARSASQERRESASVVQGTVVGIGPLAFKSYGYKEEIPVKIGDVVQFAKFAPRTVVDPERPEDQLAVMLDEDVIAIIKSKENTNE
jgi:co-chaperonin GroES (HSP10)